MSKIKIATTSLAGCFGCHMSFLDMDERLVALLEQYHFRCVLASPTARNLQRKFIPETNFQDWAPFIYEDNVEPTDGFWLRERVTYFPPTRPPDVFT